MTSPDAAMGHIGPSGDRRGAGPRPDATILICDADRALVAQIARSLTAIGCQVLTETDAASALRRLAAQHVDLILCDTELPGTDGLALLHRLRSERPDLADVPFLAMSVHADRNDIIAGKLAGADDYVVKPVDLEGLIATVEAHLRMVARLRSRFEQGLPDMIAEQQDILARMMDRLAFGVVLFTDTGTPFFCNSSARRIAACGMAEMRDWLIRQAGLPDHPGWWAGGPGPDRDQAFLVPSSQGRAGAPDWLFVTASELSQPGGDRRITAVMIFAPELSGPFTARLVGKAVGLTPAENGVARLLASGLRLEDIAARLSVSKPTVNYHLRNIYQKTATARQADLVALLHCVQLTAPASDRTDLSEN